MYGTTMYVILEIFSVFFSWGLYYISEDKIKAIVGIIILWSTLIVHLLMEILDELDKVRRC